MGSINIAFNPTQNLTIVTATGKVKADDFHRAVKKYYAGPVTALILLDLNGADLSAFHSDDIIRLAGHTSQVPEALRGGKTAIVSDKALAYGLGRMFGAYTEVGGTPFEVEIFRCHDDAKDWLGILPNPAIRSSHQPPTGLEVLHN